MIISANLASIKSRKRYLSQCIASICNQVDIVRVYCNDYVPGSEIKKRFKNANVEFYIGPDLTDNAKFRWVKNDEWYFTCDDDILYPDGYVETAMAFLKENPGKIGTFHGHMIPGEGVNYYKGTTCHHFRSTVEEDISVDVPGTGVCFFNSSKFKPDVLQYGINKAADLLVGLEAAKDGKEVVCLKHNMGWIKPTPAANIQSIYLEHRNNGKVQQELADKIFKIKK